MAAVAVSGEQPFDDDERQALARGDADAQNRLIARCWPEMRLKFEASLRSAELVATAKEETFRRVFRFFLAGHRCPDEAGLVLLVNAICGHVMKEIQRAQEWLRTVE